MAKLSVVMPVYNAAQFLPETLQSIRNQTFKDFEVVIVNDHSSDDSLTIIHEFCNLDPRFKYFNNRRSKGVSGATNTAILLTDSDLIIRSDADDISLPNRFENLYNYMIKNPQIDICGSWIKTFGANDVLITVPTNHEEIVASFMFCNSMMQPSMIFRKKVFEYSLYDETLKTAEDFHLWSKFSTKFKFANVPEALVLYRIHARNTSSTLKLETETNANEIVLNELKKIGVEDVPMFWRIIHSRLDSPKTIVFFLLSVCWLVYLLILNNRNESNPQSFTNSKFILIRIKASSLKLLKNLFFERN